MKIILIAAFGSIGLINCAHTGGDAGTSRVCAALYAPHLCIATAHNTDARPTFAAYGRNKCEALKKLSATLEDAGLTLDTVVIKCGEVAQ